MGRKQQKDTLRGIIVRFVSRRVRDSVIRARRNLRISGIVTVEDLTPRAYSLLRTVKDDTSACKEAWSKNGKIFMKALNGKIVQVKTLSDLKDSDRRKQ